MSNESRAGIILALSNQKGGVTKTTTAAALAVIYAEQGYRVLAADNDPQGNLSHQFGYGAQEIKKLPATIADVYLGSDISDAIVSTSYPNLFLLPASLKLAEVEMNLPGQAGSDLRLREPFDAIRSDWDIIVIDSAPNLGKCNANALTACDWFLVPVDAAWGLDSVGSLLSMVKLNSKYHKTNNQFLGIVLTLTDHTNITQAVKDEAAERYPGQVLTTEIRRAKEGREAATMRMPVPIYAPKSKLSGDYQLLAQEVAKRMGLAEAVAVEVKVGN